MNKSIILFILQVSRVELGKAVKNVNVTSTSNINQNENINPQIPNTNKKQQHDNVDKILTTDKFSNVNITLSSTMSQLPPKKNICVVPGRIGRPSGIFPNTLKRASSNIVPTISENNISSENLSKKMKLFKRSNSAGTWR